MVIFGIKSVDYPNLAALMNTRNLVSSIALNHSDPGTGIVACLAQAIIVALASLSALSLHFILVWLLFISLQYVYDPYFILMWFSF